MDITEQFLKELTEVHGIPGYETPVRQLITKHMQFLGEVSKDKLGSVICKKTGTNDTPRVMYAGHMDEIGFMVKYITKEGFINFLPLGGWFDQVLLGHRVTIKTREKAITGVIGAKPPHLLPSEERSKIVTKKDMYIDIGASSKEEVEEAGVRPGDPIVPQANFEVMANGKTYLAKAFDDRIGTALVIQTLEQLQKTEHPNTVFGVATVMEEVGIRGATTSVRAIDPDVAVVLEADIAGDVPGIKPDQSDIKLGKGPSVLIYDARMIPNLKLRNFVIYLAGELDIPLQLSAVEAGATDGGAIHLHNTGVPTVVLSVPSRHIHSHSSIIHRDDYDGALSLLVALTERLDQDTVASFTE